MQLPSVKKTVAENLAEVNQKFIDKIHCQDKKRIFIKRLPRSGLNDAEILAKAGDYLSMGNGQSEVLSGFVSGTVYNDIDDENLKSLQVEIYKMFCYSNPLHPMIFPDCRKMEAEVVRMVADLFNGDADVRGTMTTGGTESIMLAMLAYRNRANSKGIEEPLMLVPITAHAAFDKAAVLFGIRIRHIPVTSDGRVDVKKMERAITSDTCVLVASAPNFPTGTMDDVISVSQLGMKYDIPVHVDSCLGGFLIPFMKDAGYTLPTFDFRLPGVTSISCDTHKYGCAPKGSSVVMYRNADYVHDQYIRVPDWTGGVYATPTLLGSRAGLTIALTWSTLLHFGYANYVSRTKQIIECTKRIANAIRGGDDNNPIPGLRLLGSPDVSVVAFESDIVNIYAIGDQMSERGWHLNLIQNPPGLHICVTYNTVKANADVTFIRDLREVVNKLLGEPNKGNDSEMAAIYGLAASVPDKSIINEVVNAYLDACYAMPNASIQEHFNVS
ncbi:unnamed protein product [Anisakis simplex]|uniref:sphinganine-1-phosphate aldolase n=1 Tax=Anisakis simplex TaxID=6269 RepID=A0A0M3K191_ANISI|nr:unnamed protein product [Anisakis simplex]